MEIIHHPNNREILLILNQAKDHYKCHGLGLCATLRWGIKKFLLRLRGLSNAEFYKLGIKESDLNTLIQEWIPEFMDNRPDKDIGMEEGFWWDPIRNVPERGKYLEGLIDIYEAKILEEEENIEIGQRSGLGVIPARDSSFPIDPQCP